MTNWNLVTIGILLMLVAAILLMILDQNLKVAIGEVVIFMIGLGLTVAGSSDGPRGNNVRTL